MSAVDSARRVEDLVHVTCGPEQPTKAALAFLVAKAAIDGGHEVSLFLAGDGVQLLCDATLDARQGVGTGNLRESFDAVVAGGAAIYASGMSSQAREVSLEGKAQPAMPNRLVELALEHRTLSY
jgi:predicted peroxiredoxin